METVIGSMVVLGICGWLVYVLVEHYKENND